MKTSLLAPLGVLLCLAAPLTAAANNTPASGDGLVPLALPAASHDAEAAMQPTQIRLPAPAGSARLTLPQALRAANLAAPSLQPAAAWLALIYRQGLGDTPATPAAGDPAPRSQVQPG